MDSYSEYTHALTLYFAQAIGAFILTAILWKSYTVYKHIYLKSWSVSWLVFALYLTGASFAYLARTTVSVDGVPRLLLSFFILIFGYLQLVFLLKGTFEIATKRMVSSKALIAAIVMALIASIVFTFARNANYNDTLDILLIRVGFRAIMAGLCFIVSAIMIFKSSLVHRGLGVHLVFWTFLLYGIQQFNYFAAILAGSFGNLTFFSITGYLGILDLLLQSFMGVGMVVWLLEDERRELQKTNRELDSLVYSTSHDLRAPLASVLGLLNVARFEKNPENMPEYLSMMENRILKLDNIIGDIMVFSQNHKLGLKKSKVNINSLVKEILDDLRFSEGARNVNVTMNLNGVEFYSDPDRLKIILSNLISNAFKYKSKEAPFIKISAQKLKDRIVIAVEDNGIGIEEDQLDKIFEMFYRASDNSTGSGLGLYIVKEAVSRLGGNILVTSVPRQGSKFSIELKV